MKYKELTNKSETDLRKDLVILRGKVAELRMKGKLGQVKNMHELAGVKKDVARILTYLHTI
ncbi:MAG: 50S ribosomal protein L29 [bacterium]|nr:50S ribosomal protein L29 [bacterium]